MPLARADHLWKDNAVAQKVQILLVDDLDGGEADQTVEFALDGTSYEIDLTDASAASLRDAFAQYIGAGRKVSGRRGGRGRARGARSGGGDGPSASDMREWARSNGYEVSDRGRVSAEVRKAYDAAH